MCLALAAPKPSSRTQRTVSSMTIARVRSARSCFPLTGRRGEMLVAMFGYRFYSGRKGGSDEARHHLSLRLDVADRPIEQRKHDSDDPLHSLGVVVGQAVEFGRELG